jgi:hypothetical protein
VKCVTSTIGILLGIVLSMFTVFEMSGLVTDWLRFFGLCLALAISIGIIVICAVDIRNEHKMKSVPPAG